MMLLTGRPVWPQQVLQAVTLRMRQRQQEVQQMMVRVWTQMLLLLLPTHAAVSAKQQSVRRGGPGRLLHAVKGRQPGRHSGLRQQQTASSGSVQVVRLHLMLLLMWVVAAVMKGERMNAVGRMWQQQQQQHAVRMTSHPQAAGHPVHLAAASRHTQLWQQQQPEVLALLPLRVCLTGP